MLIVVDKRLPDHTKVSLRKYGIILEFITSDITYQSISGHPDIFFCSTSAGLVVAPNTPNIYLEKLKKAAVSIITGNSPVGKSYPASATYNALCLQKLLIHNTTITDLSISKQYKPTEFINVKQGYTRCNLVGLPDGTFITSDVGIKKILESRGEKVLYFNPKGIILPGQSEGFFGGCCGIIEDEILLTGSLRHHEGGEKAREFIIKSGLKITELSSGPLWDSGSILFLE